MILRFALLSATAFAAFGSAACGRTQTAANPIPPAIETPSAAQVDQQKAEAQTFIDAAGQTSLAEIETSKLALAHAKDGDTKSFAQQLIDDHAKATEALTAAAQTAGLKPPAASLDDFHMRRVNDLTADQTQGDRNFDADYAALQVDANKDAIDLFQGYIKDGDIPALKAFAEQTLPKLKEHRQHAQMLNDAVKGKAASPG